ncbi:WD40-repeat-containing domain protein [Gloeopeniophorella convolvens]|nr:WD40-repeat-containing domain protein [Gloeopeniophorella convolvens]
MAAAPITIDADEVNCLVYSYLKDSGFKHTAFNLLNEGGLQHSAHFEKHIPRGELIELLIKALLYTEVEAHWRGNNDMIGNCTTGFSLLETHVCSMNPNVKPNVKLSNNAAPLSASVVAAVQPVSISERSDAGQKRKASTPGTDDGQPEKRQKTTEAEVTVTVADERNPEASTSRRPSTRRTRASGNAPSKKPASRAKSPKHLEVEENEDVVRQLKGHHTEVFVCSWNPARHELLSTGSKDAVVHLWELPKSFDSDSGPGAVVPHRTLDSSTTKLEADLTSLDWNNDGTLLSVGSYDAILRVYTASAELYFESKLHKGPIFATRFSKDGKWLASASLDNTVCLWDVQRKEMHMQYKHKGICLDVDWLDDEFFASCSADKTIHLLSIHQSEPIAVLTGHDGEVNQIKASPMGTHLLSCSDDATARIWDIRKHKRPSDPPPGVEYASVDGEMVVLRGHRNWVNGVAWNPVVQASGPAHIVATASFDMTSRFWDGETGACLKVFNHHTKPIYTLGFSPDGRLFATGAGDGFFHLYDTEKEKIYSWQSEHQKRAIFEISWQQDADGADRVALALQSHKVGVIDLSRIPVVRELRAAS